MPTVNGASSVQLQPSSVRAATGEFPASLEIPSRRKWSVLARPIEWLSGSDRVADDVGDASAE